jgi:hypothetical protein
MSTNYFLRTEPRTTDSSLSEGIAARVYDPLWMLGRQWQVGELIGEDAGSPVNAALATQTATIGTYRPSAAAADTPYDPSALPLEAVVEAAPVRTAANWTLRLRMDTGRELLRVIEEAGFGRYVAGFVQAYPFAAAAAATRAADPSAARLLDLAVGRFPDGQPIYDDVVTARRDGTPLPLPPGVDPGDVGPLESAVGAWFDAAATTLLEPGPAGPAWNPDTLDYSFSVATSTDPHALRLDAPDHRGGALDWHAFDVRPETAPADFGPPSTLAGLPTGVRFRGMPNPRWWEFEDASVDFGSVDAGPSDGARLAMLEFGLVYGNDFFAIPLRLAVGSLCRVSSLVVADTFGMQLAIGPAAHGGGRQGDARWSMFTLSERAAPPSGGGPVTGTGVGDVFFLPPVAGQVIADRPVEEVVLLRDEMADMAWAVERKFEGARGIAEDRIEATMRNRAPAPPPTVNAELHYLLGTTVPTYWFPLVPERLAGDVRLALETMVGAPADARPRNTFIALGGDPIPDAAVPREGRRLLRDYVFGRWSNGLPIVWSRRRSLVGRGEGSSGLRFDVAEETQGA